MRQENNPVRLFLAKWCEPTCSASSKDAERQACPTTSTKKSRHLSAFFDLFKKLLQKNTKCAILYTIIGVNVDKKKNKAFRGGNYESTYNYRLIYD